MANTANTRSKMDKWNEIKTKCHNYLYVTILSKIRIWFEQFHFTYWYELVTLKPSNSFISHNSVFSLLFFSVGIGFIIFLRFDFCMKKNVMKWLLIFTKSWNSLIHLLRNIYSLYIFVFPSLNHHDHSQHYFQTCSCFHHHLENPSTKIGSLKTLRHFSRLQIVKILTEEKLRTTGKGIYDPLA